MNDAVIKATKLHAERASGEGALDRVFQELAALARAAAGSRRLARVLADPDMPSQAKASLLQDVGGGRLHSVTVEVVGQIPSVKRVQAAELPLLISDVVALFGLSAAMAAGTLPAFELGLHELAAIIRSSPELRSTLVNPGLSTLGKESLVADILHGKTDERVVEIAKVLVSLDDGVDVDGKVEALSIAAAAQRNAVVADIRTAVALDDARRNALIAGLQQAIGKTIEPRFVVDPAILGSVVVRLGDEVFDGSVRHRIEQARKELVES